MQNVFFKLLTSLYSGTYAAIKSNNVFESTQNHKHFRFLNRILKIIIHIHELTLNFI